MKDYTKVCWGCGSKAVEAKGGYYQCQDCGATYNPMPKVAPQEFATEEIPESGIKSYRPTKSLVRRIKKQREGK